MIRPAVVLAVAAIGACLTPNGAFALSCARPTLDQAVIEDAAAIFEGQAGATRPLTLFEKAKLQPEEFAQLGGGTSDLRIYTFTVSRGWKTFTAGQKVEVLYNTYWGDGFVAGETYLVVSPQRVAGLLWAPLCGHTKDTRFAEKIGDTEKLARVLGIGEHIKVPVEARACRNDADCTTVQTHCGGCSCGTPVAWASAQDILAQFAGFCAAARISERCLLDCVTPRISCRQGLCVAE